MKKNELFDDLDGKVDIFNDYDMKVITEEEFYQGEAGNESNFYSYDSDGNAYNSRGFPIINWSKTDKMKIGDVWNHGDYFLIKTRWRLGYEISEEEYIMKLREQKINDILKMGLNDITCTTYYESKFTNIKFIQPYLNHIKGYYYDERSKWYSVTIGKKRQCFYYPDLNCMDFSLFDLFRKLIEDNHTMCFRNQKIEDILK